VLPFVVLLPVKPPARGKSRLAGGLPPDQRTALATAFALDTLAAAREAAPVAEVMVVTDDFRFAARARELGCAVLPDGVSGSLNASLVQAAHEAARRWPSYGVAALCADLPALDPADLTVALEQVPDRGAVFVADAVGTGTTMYAARGLDAFSPSFGTGSRDAHLASGAIALEGDLSTLRQDVDDPGDLGRAMLLGVGRHTAAATGRR
jgi:2-phospho-L-lactate guanylyltransferase